MKLTFILISFLVQITIYGQAPNYAIYNSQGHSKSLGLDFTIKYPPSWEPQEGNRPHIVQKFVNQLSPDMSTIMVQIRDIGININKKEIESELSIQNLKKILPSNSKYISSQTQLLIDGQRSASVDYIITRTSQNTIVNKDLQVYTRIYVLFWKNYMINIQCSVGQTDINENALIGTFNNYKSIFLFAANSFVINSKWQ